MTREVVLDVEDVTPAVKDPWGSTRMGATATTRINRRDFGLTLLEHVLPYELQAEVSLHFAPAGLSCTMELPLTARIVAEEANLTN